MNSRMQMLGWLSLLLTISIAAPGASTNIDWSLRVWQSDEGLPDNDVVGVGQGADGFLWVATRSGLARFDCLRFREFTFSALNTAGAPTARLDALFLDRSNRVWIAKDRGVLVCIDHGRKTALTAEDGLPLHPVKMMVEDRAGALWVSYIGGSGVGGDVIRILAGRVQNFSAKDGLPGGNSTCQLVSDKKGQIWFAQGSGVGVFGGERFVSLYNLQAQRIAAARSGGIWIYRNSPPQLFKTEDGSKLLALGTFPLPHSRANADVNILFEDHTGALWIGTRRNGLFRYDGYSFSPVETSHYEILSLTEDRDGNLWVGTGGGGLNRIRPRSLKLVDVGSGIDSEAVRSVCQDTAGDFWAVTQSGVLVRTQADGWTNVTSHFGFSDLIAQCVAADPRGGIWIGTQYKGLFSLRNGVVTSVNKLNGLAAQSVRSLLVTPKGDVWIGTESSNALQRLREGLIENFPLPSGSGFITAMALDDSGIFWAGTSDGLLMKCDRDSLVDETGNTLVPAEPIRSLCSTPDGSVWIGYGGRGLGRLRGAGFSQFATEDGLNDDYISHITADRQGRLWFAGNRGIFYVKQSDFDVVESGPRTRLRSVVYGSDEGWPSLQANYGFCPGAILATNGNLLIPMLKGLASLNVDHLKQNLKQPSVVITRVIVDGRTVALYESGNPKGSFDSSDIVDLAQANPKLRLAPDNQRVEIEFTALNLTAPRNVSFRYQLEGLDKAGWGEIGSKREVTYTHIAAGNYSFRVQACNEWGLWSDPAASFTIQVMPYYWQTWTFRILVTLTSCALVAGSVASVARLRHRRRIEQLERQRAMERERARIAQDLHDDLGSGLTEISFGSEFAQDPSLGLVETRQYTHEMGVRARELVAALDEIVWAVNPQNDTVASLASYLCQYAERFLKPTRLRLRLKVTRDLPAFPLNAEERHNLFLAFKEALHNVVQHSQATDVQLTIEVDSGVLTVIVADNGCGFEPKMTQSEADGLVNMRRRLERIRGQHELVSLVGKGTTATFKLPLQKVAGVIGQ